MYDSERAWAEGGGKSAPRPLSNYVCDLRQAPNPPVKCGENTSIWSIPGIQPGERVYLIEDETNNFIGPVVDGDAGNWVYVWSSIQDARDALNRYCVEML